MLLAVAPAFLLEFVLRCCCGGLFVKRGAPGEVFVWVGILLITSRNSDSKRTGILVLGLLLSC